MIRRLHGDVGRVVNSFVSLNHPDAIDWQRRFRMALYAQRTYHTALLAAIRGPVYLVASKHSVKKYSFAIRLPDYIRILRITRTFTISERAVFAHGGLPQVLYPKRRLKRLLRVFRDTPIFANAYVDEDPLPWSSCHNTKCCSRRQLKRKRQ